MCFTVNTYAQLDMYGPVIKTDNFDTDMLLDFYARAGKLMALNQQEAR